MEQEQSVFESDSYVKVYFTMAIPVVFSLVITIVYNITDTCIAGYYGVLITQAAADLLSALLAVVLFARVDIG